MKTFTDTAAERALLASVFLAGDVDPARIVPLTLAAYSRLATRVSAADFFDPRHGRVWAAMGGEIGRAHV